MSHFFDNRDNVYPPVIPGADLNYEYDLSYMKKSIRKKGKRRGKTAGIILGIILGIAATVVLFLMHRQDLQKKVDAQISEHTAYSCEAGALCESAILKTQLLAASDAAHDILAAELDDGDCTTAVVCPCCDTVLIEARAEHIPVDDDGDCTTAVGCANCSVILTPANPEHTPEADDGDCTTEIRCSVCNTVTTPAKEHVPNDDGDCTTDDMCSNDGCTQLATPANTEHTPIADDGDCTTEIGCQHCSVILTPANSEHSPEADDDDCTTEIRCSVCNTVTTPAKEHVPNDDGDCTTDDMCSNDGCTQLATPANTEHTPIADDGDCTTEIGCQHCSVILTPANSEHSPEADDGDCTTEVKCSNCTVVLTQANEKHTISEDDGRLTTDILCTECETVLVPAPITYDGYKKAVLYMAGIGIAAAFAMLILCLLIGRISGSAKAKKYEKRLTLEEKCNKRRFDAVREALLKGRENLICESITTVSDDRSSSHFGTKKQREGRIFLTDEAIEFYDNDFSNLYKNFTVPLNCIQIINVEDNERNNTFTINSTRGCYSFIVPDESASCWKSQILAAWERNKRPNGTCGGFSSISTVR